MFIVSREHNSQTIWFSPDGGKTRSGIRNLDHLELIVLAGAIDAKTGKRLTAAGVDATWKTIGVLTAAELDSRLGKKA